MSDDTTRNLQLIEKNMLIETAKLLKANQIPFFLAFGTALGAVRHHGFIPWDDDIDIYVKGSDYPKIQSVFKKEKTGNLELQDFSMIADYPYVIPKIIDRRTMLKENAFKHLEYNAGVYIDIFPLFEVDDRTCIRKIREKFRYLAYAYVKACYLEPQQLSRTIRLAVKILRKIISPAAAQKYIYKTYTSMKHRGEKMIDPLDFNEKHYCPKEWFSGSAEVPFEGAKMPVSAEYDKYLTKFYGDYMQLPKEEDRVTNHDFAMLNIEKALQ